MKQIEGRLYELLQKVDTPTVCNAIEVAQGGRGFANFSRKPVYAADPTLPAVLGFARTARISAKQPPSIPVEQQKQLRLDYYRFMAEGPSQGLSPAICVIQDIDYPDCTGSFWGEINNYSHRALGLSGTLTDGLMRDLDVLAPGYQVLAGGIGPSHAFVHVLDFDIPVHPFGLCVETDDLIHADRHGALVIPEDVIGNLYEAIQTLIANEERLLSKVRNAQNMSFADFSAIWKEFANSRT